MPKRRTLFGGVTVPTNSTLLKYGLTLDSWAEILKRQDFKCAVCKLTPGTGRLCIDHDHVKGFKKLPFLEKRRYVRGLLCWFCNQNYVGRAITIEKARRVVEYLEEHASKRIKNRMSE